jgi:hypothetical protein
MEEFCDRKSTIRRLPLRPTITLVRWLGFRCISRALSASRPILAAMRWELNPYPHNLWPSAALKTVQRDFGPS